jgi:hypothetical protein
MRKRQGRIFSIELHSDRIKFKLFALIPWASIRLDDVEYFRISSKNEYYQCMRDGETVLFWPLFIRGYGRRMAPIYVIKSMRDGRKFFFRARSAFHYMIRTAIGRARARNNGGRPVPW